MSQRELENWFESNKTLLENAYTAAQEPWKQSGMSGPAERWETLRRPVADCIEASGSLLDIGCANGYLLECILKWTAERGITVTPYGLDLSAKLAEMAKQRLPNFADNIFVGNAWNWPPPFKFDYVRTELCYLPEALYRDYVARLLAEYLKPGGRLLVAHYRNRNDPDAAILVNETLEKLGFKVEGYKSALDSKYGWEGTRVAVIKN